MRLQTIQTMEYKYVFTQLTIGATCSHSSPSQVSSLGLFQALKEYVTKILETETGLNQEVLDIIYETLSWVDESPMPPRVDVLADSERCKIRCSKQKQHETTQDSRRQTTYESVVGEKT